MTLYAYFMHLFCASHILFENFFEFSRIDVKFHQFLKQNFIPGLFQHCLTQRAVEQSVQCYIKMHLPKATMWYPYWICIFYAYLTWKFIFDWVFWPPNLLIQMHILKSKSTFFSLPYLISLFSLITRNGQSDDELTFWLTVTRRHVYDCKNCFDVFLINYVNAP